MVVQLLVQLIAQLHPMYPPGYWPGYSITLDARNYRHIRRKIKVA